MKNSIFIGTSLDGYIADKYGGLDYLDAIQNPTMMIWATTLSYQA